MVDIFLIVFGFLEFIIRSVLFLVMVCTIFGAVLIYCWVSDGDVKLGDLLGSTLWGMINR